MATTLPNPKLVSAAAPEAPLLSTPRSFEATLLSAASTISLGETIRLAVDSFRASKVRFLLTMLGMVIGSASIILVVTVGLTGRQYALETISGLGPNKVEMQYGGGDVMGPNNVSTPDMMTREDIQAVRDQVPGIIASSPMLETHFDVAVGSGRTENVMVLGVSPEYKTIRNLKVVAGRFFDDEDARTHASVTVMVLPLAIKLYGSAQKAVGNTISDQGIPFTIIGVFRESTDTYGQSEISDRTVLIPYEVARYFTGSDQVKEIFFQMSGPNEVEPGAREITRVIQSRHRAGSVYVAQTLTNILATLGEIANIMTIVLTLAAFITLVVSGVGIMNSMLANVSARIREIGIRKALGATRREIRLQFLTEAVFLSLAGGIIGTLVGLAIPFSAWLFTPFKIPISGWSIVIALSTSVIVGVIFGTVPANRAANLDPVDTLKYE
jgi:putative ABC transport system permease protein